MKKFNKEMYKEIIKNGTYKDEYYKYVVIEKNKVFKGWSRTYLEGQTYEFFGIIDKQKKDIFTLKNMEELQEELIQEVKNELKDEILKNKNEYIKIQQTNFNIKIKNEKFEKDIMYQYIYDNYIDNFRELYIKGTTAEQFENDLLSHLIRTKKVYNNESFLNKFQNETTEEIKRDLKEYFTSDEIIDKWDFERAWNNSDNDTIKIECNFKNDISLKLNKIDYIVEQYKKIIKTPSEQLKKSKLLYNLCDEFKKNNDNKTCYIELKDNLTLKVIDFDYLITIFKQGNEKNYTYRLLTSGESYQLEQYNARTKGTSRDDELHITDIKKIYFSKKTIYNEEEAQNEQ